MPSPDCLCAQIALIATFAIGRIAADPGWAVGPNSTPSWNRRSAYETMLRDWISEEQFGEGLRAALLAEAKGRGLTQRLHAADWSMWRNVAQ
ncbi:MAG: hypothetical protein HN742_10390 [Lentisphaerae bacterium]|nr:hypothetical protein [Lentisphaerota bacterium]MBT4816449.1 hypothetical protein [Lentisphaerota bacterium]MBT5611367.1 hypothetical protein [Lentisphaerota bacterium]MBT7061548.1 hypothetical protein [Lentisphaerota bacterium]MBT7842272.1 hypothetical protein [Lentisphaerota bacterium]